MRFLETPRRLALVWLRGEKITLLASVLPLAGHAGRWSTSHAAALLSLALPGAFDSHRSTETALGYSFDTHGATHSPPGPHALSSSRAGAADDASTANQRARHAADEDDDPYLSPRSRLAGYVLNGGTEPAFSSPLNDIKQSGDFVCARKGCDAVLFRTDTKYDSGTGWPSFWDPVDDNVKLEKGNFLSFMFGTECKCAKCDGHLGHRFDDGPIMKTGKNCINGAALRFRPKRSARASPVTHAAG